MMRSALWWVRSVMSALTLACAGFCPCGGSAAEDVSLRSGELWLSQSDAVVQTARGPVDLVRSYRVETPAGLLGPGWSLDIAAELSVLDDALLLLADRGEQRLLSRRPPAAGYRSADGVQAERATDGGWLVDWPDGSLAAFDPSGRLVARSDAGGSAMRLAYDQAGRLAEVWSVEGHPLRLTYDEKGRLTAVSEPSGGRAEYGYDDAGWLTTARDAEGWVTRFVYNGAGRLAEVRYPDGRMVSLAYDEKGRVTERKSSDAPVLRYAYRPDATRVMRADGYWWEQHFDARGLPVAFDDSVGRTRRWTWDAAGRLVSEVSGAGSTAYAYDEQGRLTEVRGSRGETVRYAYDGPSGRPVLREVNGSAARYQYDGAGRLSAVTSPAGRKTAYGYDEAGRLAAVTDGAGHTTNYRFDLLGNLVEAIGPAGDSTAWRYDARGRLIAERDPTGAVTTYAYDAKGLLASVSAPDLGVLSYRYDETGRLTEEASETGITRYAYDPAGRLARVEHPDGTSERYAYGPDGRMVEATGRSRQSVRYETDVLGRVLRVDESGSPGLSASWDDQGLAGVKAGSVEMRFTRNGARRSVTIRQGAGAPAVLAVDAVAATSELTLPNGGRERRKYDPDGLLEAVDLPEGASWRYRYDGAGALTEILGGDGRKTRFEYVAGGRLAAFSPPYGKPTRYRYDAAGRPVERVNGRGQKVAYEYDPAGWLAAKKTAEATWRYRYDGRGNLVEASDGSFTVRHAYDRLGRLVETEYPAWGKRLAYRYDERGRLAARTDPDGKLTRYAYDGDGRLASIEVGDAVFRFGYDASGRAVRRDNPNGTATEYAYDDAGRTVRVTHNDASGQPMAALAYEYDAAGNRVAATDEKGERRRFGYDQQGRLTSDAGGKGQATLRYGPAGDRLASSSAAGTQTYKYDTGGRLVQAGDVAFTYDADGNLTSRKDRSGTVRFDYDSEGNLARVTLPGGKTVRYGYDPFGERLWRETDGRRTYFLNDGDDLLQELSSSFAPLATYAYAGLDVPLMQYAGSGPRYFHQDAVGNVVAVSDASGKRTLRTEYDAFGNLLSGDVADRSLGFSARPFERATGLYDLRARFYDPRTGRFTTPEPVLGDIDDPASLAAYVYARNNPQAYSDPFGLQPDDRSVIPVSPPPPQPSIGELADRVGRVLPPASTPQHPRDVIPVGEGRPIAPAVPAVPEGATRVITPRPPRPGSPTVRLPPVSPGGATGGAPPSPAPAGGSPTIASPGPYGGAPSLGRGHHTLPHGAYSPQAQTVPVPVAPRPGPPLSSTPTLRVWKNPARAPNETGLFNPVKPGAPTPSSSLTSWGAGRPARILFAAAELIGHAGAELTNLWYGEPLQGLAGYSTQDLVRSGVASALSAVGSGLLTTALGPTVPAVLMGVGGAERVYRGAQEWGGYRYAGWEEARNVLDAERVKQDLRARAPEVLAALKAKLERLDGLRKTLESLQKEAEGIALEIANERNVASTALQDAAGLRVRGEAARKRLETIALALPRATDFRSDAASVSTLANEACAPGASNAAALAAKAQQAAQALRARYHSVGTEATRLALRDASKEVRNLNAAAEDLRLKDRVSATVERMQVLDGSYRSDGRLEKLGILPRFEIAANEARRLQSEIIVSTGLLQNFPDLAADAKSIRTEAERPLPQLDMNAFLSLRNSVYGLGSDKASPEWRVYGDLATVPDVERVLTSVQELEAAVRQLVEKAEAEAERARACAEGKTAGATQPGATGEAGEPPPDSAPPSEPPVRGDRADRAQSRVCKYLLIEPAKVEVRPRQSVSFSATAVYDDGTRENVTGSAVWEPGNSYTAPADLRFNEKVTISARFDGCSGSSDITALAPSWSPPLSHADQLGAQGQQPGPADEKWYALCQKQGLQVVYGKSTDPTRYHVMQGPFPGPRNAEFWIRQNCPSWKCTAAGACAGVGEVRGGGNWAAVCSRSHGGAAVTQHPNVTQHWVWKDHLFGEPDARAWMDQNCPSWRCDRDGRCLAGSRPQETTTSGQPVEVPPDASDVVRQFDARRQARDQSSWGSGYGASAWERPGRFSAEGMRQEMETRSAEAAAGAAAAGARDRSRTGASGTGTHCHSDAECPAGSVCRSERCVPAGTTGTSTGTPAPTTGTTTGTRTGTTGGGTLRMNEACRSSAECAAGLFCDRGLCRPQTASTPAATGTTTSGGTPGLGNRCTSDRECPSPLKCINKVCLHAEHPRAGTGGATTAQATTPSGPYVPKGTGTACPSVGSQVAARCQQMAADCKARNCAGGGYSGCAVDCPGCAGSFDHITGWCTLHPSYAGMASGGLSTFVGEIQSCITRFLADNQAGRRERGAECQGQAQKRLDDNWKRWVDQVCQARCSQDGRRGVVKVMPHRCECQ